jgi:hypothetical protein
MTPCRGRLTRNAASESDRICVNESCRYVESEAANRLSDIVTDAGEALQRRAVRRYLTRMLVNQSSAATEEGLRPPCEPGREHQPPPRLSILEDAPRTSERQEAREDCGCDVSSRAMQKCLGQQNAPGASIGAPGKPVATVSRVPSAQLKPCRAGQERFIPGRSSHYRQFCSTGLVPSAASPAFECLPWNSTNTEPQRTRGGLESGSRG